MFRGVGAIDLLSSGAAREVAPKVVLDLTPIGEIKVCVIRALPAMWKRKYK
jgi:hypothetical protein